jgi:hypothetical protein
VSWTRTSSLQETILADDTDQAAEIRDSGYHLAQQEHREADGQGITTASRWPFGRLEMLVAESPGHVIVAGTWTPIAPRTA